MVNEQKPVCRDCLDFHTLSTNSYRLGVCANPICPLYAIALVSSHPACANFKPRSGETPPGSDRWMS